ncbi:LacI family DNA-binding transcriptional regulator [Streptomyces anulatus]|uniref:LacI family DNA-binding transcriptional regulator n=1 Tax=Streptomyces anulatus TaxID=1892 RepID=UPI00364C849B
MRVTIADVAREAGVSKTTVSRVINTKGEVDRSTAARVREVIAQLGYVPSSGAVGLARGSSRTVGMLVPSLTWPWMGELLQGVVDTVEAADYGLLLFTCNRGAESVQRFTSQVSARAFDGLVVVEPENTLGHLTELHRDGLPIVLIDDRGHHPEFPSVVTTNHEGGASAARHLRAAGRSRPLVLTGPQHFGCVRDRLDGFRSVLPTELVVEGDFTERGGRLAVEELLARGVAFDSVFAHNDISAAGVLRALRAAGRRVPDDIPMAEHTEPPLTTVRQPTRRMGETAARMLLSHLGGTPVPDRPAVLPTELVVRHSAP